MYRHYTLLFSLFFCLAFPAIAQQSAATPADARLNAFAQRQQLKSNSLLAALEPLSIGPSIFSCRVNDVEVNPADPTKFYVAYASGGLWYSESNGTAFKSLFDHEASMTIGDIAVDWQRKVLWVGTGENNSSRSSYAGTGIYRSTDAGKNWQHLGLSESHHIGRIVLHPYNPDIVWVAVLGHLYTPNAERGVYKTSDGGKTWQRTLFANENTGAIDLIVDPGNPNTLYAATWERERHAWDFKGAGSGSQIWKSTDGGENWNIVSTPASGFPTGVNAGRIGLCAGRKNGVTTLFASIDNQDAKPKKETTPATDALTKDQLKSMDKGSFLALADDKLATYLKNNNFPEKYTASKVKGLIEKDKLKPIALVEYLEDANANLFEANYKGAEVYRSDDDGKTWRKTHEEPLEMINFTYGYYFSNVRCAPNNPDQVYLMGFFIIRSDDGGKTWKKISRDNVHADHHALWVNADRPGHLINGNDGGLNISWDNGESWIKCNNPPVGQFYAIATDEAEPYNVYGGAQDNGVWTGPSDYKASSDWHQSGQYPYKELLGGDGMQVQVDTRNNNTVFTGFQFGNYFRVNKTTGQTKPITPRPELGERPLRFNWQTPIHLSQHNQDILYFGANKLYRSFDQGEHWEVISGDLTAGGRKGNVPYGTLSAIHESPLKFGLLYAGSDDGLLHVSRDGGDIWTKISDGLPQNLWISRVQASAHERGRVYVSLNGYRSDDFTAYLYVSENFGATWARIGENLPAEPVNVVREDPVNPNVLYVGTDHNAYISLDRGKTFQTLSSNFPDVPVHDMVLQAKTGDLVIGTHGRSMFKINMKPVQQLTPDVLAADIHLFEFSKQKIGRNWGKKASWQELKDPELPVLIYANAGGAANWSVKTKEGLLLRTGTFECRKGMNILKYAFDVQEDAIKKYRETLQKEAKKSVEIEKSDTGKYYLKKGNYVFSTEKNGKTSVQELILE